ncbi:MAG: chromosomal replication initiator protein DnaA [Sandaracinaceae bacterium]|nr:chromosomal replication initiator protein DnaA [Sandaracinaceae bacterium]
MSHLWESALLALRPRLSEENFRTWLEPLALERFEDGVVTLRIPNRFYADWISSQYLPLILDALTQESGTTDLQVEWVVDESLQKSLDEQAEEARRVASATRPPTPSAPPPPPLESGAPAESGLNPKYRFDNFIVGPSNQLAHAASVAAASSPGARYNPLFIYGGVGLGKTHLVNAIGHRIRQEKADARVLFVSAERFTNEFIWALQNHRISEFRERYRRRCDVLCIDDIQFLAGREQTQEEFFHTFNALYHADRQIVVTSDVYPQQIREMEERLVSRFQWGLVADIQAPAIDTRIAILKKKAEQEQIALDDEVALLIAQHVQSNVRELEGTLLRLAVKAELVNKRVIDVELATSALGAIAPRVPEKQTTVEDIQRAACEYFGIRLAELKSHRRHRAVSFPRMVAMFVCRQHLNTSYPSLGDLFGGKDHTTVLSACRKIGGLYDSEDREVLQAVAAIERKVGLPPLE